MGKLEYMINPVLMGGLVKETTEETVKVHLHGRLGVITIPRSCVLGEAELHPGTEMSFYFSYLEVNEAPYDYDAGAIKSGAFEPSFIGGTICEVNDTAIKADIMDGLGTVAVPRRWVFTSVPLEVGQTVEFYFSPMKAV
jgi:hypothetical protein